MAITRISVKTNYVWTSTDVGWISSGPQAHQTGNTLIVVIGGYAVAQESVLGVTDLAGNTFVKADAVTNLSDEYRAEIWYARNITGHASNEVTAVWSDALDYRGIVVLEYAGLSTVNPFDTSAKSATAATTGTLTTTIANEVHILLSRWGSAHTYPAGFTEVTGSGIYTNVGEKIVSSLFSGSYTVTGGQYYAIVGAFGDTAPTAAVSVRATQHTLELLSQPTTPAARITGDTVEVLSQPLLPAARVTQDVIEILSVPTAVPAPGRVTQAVVEMLSENLIPEAPALVTQAVVELLSVPTTGVVTQAVVEVLAYNPPGEPGFTQVGALLAQQDETGPLTISQAGAQIAQQERDVKITQAGAFLGQQQRRVWITQVGAYVALVPRPPDDFPEFPICPGDFYPLLPSCSDDRFPVLPTEACMDASTFVTNMALQEIGVTKTIDNLLTDTSQEAYAARLVFSDVMDTVLRDHPWKFATEYRQLTWNAGSIEFPVSPDWTYLYNLPSDCVRVRRVCDPPQQRRYTTEPIPFDLRADPTGLLDLLLCNEPGAGQLPAPAEGDLPAVTIEYTKRLQCPAQVNDAQFREAVVYKLAARLAKGLGRDSKDADRCLRNYQMALPKAQTQHANDAQRQRPTDAPPDWILGR